MRTPANGLAHNPAEAQPQPAHGALWAAREAALATPGFDTAHASPARAERPKLCDTTPRPCPTLR